MRLRSFARLVMERFVALYRGINVGGNNLVSMEVLRGMHEGLGHTGVASYIQSGNVIFSAKGTAEKVAGKIAAAFKEEFGFAPKVMVVGAERWGAIVRDNPFAKFSAKEPKTVHACICEGEPSDAGLGALLTKTGGKEKFVIKDGVIYVHAPDGFGTSRFAAGMEKACGVPITARNWRTMETLLKMLGEPG
jgi:uncharacterized protein (DUF1697 family)